MVHEWHVPQNLFGGPNVFFGCLTSCTFKTISKGHEISGQFNLTFPCYASSIA